MASLSPRTAGYPDADYDLNTHDGEVSTVWRHTDSGVRLSGNRIGWTAGGRTHEAPLADIASIRLTTAVDSLRGPMGATACRIRFSNGAGVTVFGGNSFNPDEPARAVRYCAFVDDLHRRLGPKERASIRFIAGFGGARFGIGLVLVIVASLFFIVTPLVLLLITGEARLLIAPLFGVFLIGGLLKLVQTNAPHVYDPANPADSARAGSIGDTLSHAAAEWRENLTLKKALALMAGALAVVAIVVLVVASHQTADLFENGRARLALDAIRAQAGGSSMVVKIEVTPQMLTMVVPDRDSSAPFVWTASRRTLFGWSEWDNVTGPTKKYDVSISEEASQEKFKLQPDDVAGLDGLAKAAVARAALGEGSAVADMVLTEAPQFIHTEEPRWTVRIAGRYQTA